MVETTKVNRKQIKDIAFRIGKATIKTIIIYVAYVLLMPILTPLLQLMPSFAGTIQTFVTVYVIFMIIGELTARTMLQHVVNVATALFVISYLILSAGNSVISASFQNLNLTVNLSTFFTIALALSLLGLAKSMLQLINLLSQRAERALPAPSLKL